MYLARAEGREERRSPLKALGLVLQHSREAIVRRRRVDTQESIVAVSTRGASATPAASMESDYSALRGLLNEYFICLVMLLAEKERGKLLAFFLEISDIAAGRTRRVLGLYRREFL